MFSSQNWCETHFEWLRNVKKNKRNKTDTKQKRRKKETIIKELRGIPPDRPLNRFTLTVKGYDSYDATKERRQFYNFKVNLFGTGCDNDVSFCLYILPTPPAVPAA